MTEGRSAKAVARIRSESYRVSMSVKSAAASSLRSVSSPKGTSHSALPSGVVSIYSPM